MRLICSLKDEQQAQELYYFLIKEGIHSQFECTQKEGEDPRFKIWVVSEDDVQQAAQWYKEFSKDPNASLFKGHYRVAKETLEKQEAEKAAAAKAAKPKKIKIGRTPQATGRITLMMLLLCILFFSWAELTRNSLNSNNNTAISQLPRIYKDLTFDYPSRIMMEERLLRIYSIEQVQNPDSLPPVGKKLYKELYNSSVWDGYYNQLIRWYHGQDTLSLSGKPLFERIREGQVWRLFTPSLLHGSFFHIFFNLIWLIILGNQMESRMKSGRYLFFILCSGIVSNIAQYMMGGYLFIGYSGVISAMIAFVWIRQKNAPWEGYQLQHSTVVFVSMFILGFAVLQGYSFYQSLTGVPPSFDTPIANTAHIAGACIGAILGKFDFFKIQ